MQGDDPPEVGDAFAGCDDAALPWMPSLVPSVATLLTRSALRNIGGRRRSPKRDETNAGLGLRWPPSASNSPHWGFALWAMELPSASARKAAATAPSRQPAAAPLVGRARRGHRRRGGVAQSHRAAAAAPTAEPAPPAPAPPRQPNRPPAAPVGARLHARRRARAARASAPAAAASGPKPTACCRASSPSSPTSDPDRRAPTIDGGTVRLRHSIPTATFGSSTSTAAATPARPRARARGCVRSTARARSPSRSASRPTAGCKRPSPAAPTIR